MRYRIEAAATDAMYYPRDDDTVTYTGTAVIDPALSSNLPIMHWFIEEADYIAARTPPMIYTDDGLSNRPPYGAVWDFGDASGDTSSPHTYTAAGTYTVTLTLTDQDGCPGVAVYSITVLDVSQLLISKVADRATAVVGDVVQFDLTVQNSGAAQSLTSVVVSDTVPTGTNFVWCSGGCTQVGGDVLAQAGQRVREVDHVVELLLVAAPAPGVVVAVLLAPGGVEAGRLQMAVGIRADPHVAPGGRDRQLADARQVRRVADKLAVGLVVGEAAPALDAGDPGPRAVGATQASHAAVSPARRPGTPTSSRPPSRAWRRASW